MKKIFIYLALISYVFVSCQESFTDDFVGNERKHALRKNNSDTISNEINNFNSVGRDTILSNGIIIKIIDGKYFLLDDVVLTKEQVDLFGIFNLSRTAFTMYPIKYWKDGVVYYTLSNITDTDRVMAAINYYQTHTSVKFIQGTGNGDYVEFKEYYTDGDVYSEIGCVGGKQIVHLGYGYTTGNIMHEIGHVLGLFHEHCRSDRDQYIDVYYDNIIPDKVDNNFQIIPEITTIGPMDFYSIMMYGSDAFTRNGQYTMLKKDNTPFFSQRNYLSYWDLATISSIYGPPFHKLNIRTTDEEYIDNGTSEIERSTNDYVLYFYSDENFTQRTSLEYDRRIRVTKVSTTWRYGVRQDNVLNYDILVPAGSYEYTIGTGDKFINTDYGTLQGFEEKYYIR